MNLIKGIITLIGLGLYFIVLVVGGRKDAERFKNDFKEFTSGDDEDDRSKRVGY